MKKSTILSLAIVSGLLFTGVESFAAGSKYNGSDTKSNNSGTRAAQVSANENDLTDLKKEEEKVEAKVE